MSVCFYKHFCDVQSLYVADLWETEWSDKSVKKVDACAESRQDEKPEGYKDTYAAAADDCKDMESTVERVRLDFTRFYQISELLQ